MPLQCEYYALEGISMLNRIMGQLHDGVNADHAGRWRLFGVVSPVGRRGMGWG